MKNNKASKTLQNKMQEFDRLMVEGWSPMTKDTHFIVAIPSLDFLHLRYEQKPCDPEHYKEAELFVDYIKQKVGAEHIEILTDCLDINKLLCQSPKLDYLFFLHPFEECEVEHILNSMMGWKIGRFTAYKLYEVEENVA